MELEPVSGPAHGVADRAAPLVFHQRQQIAAGVRLVIEPLARVVSQDVV